MYTKRILPTFFTFLFLAIGVNAQELFTETFQLLAPFSVHTIEDDLYVGTFGEDGTRPGGIYKVPFNNPNNEVLVSQIDFGGLGVLELVHDEATNILYASNVTGIYMVDLNLPLPITPELLYDGDYRFNFGLLFKDGSLYASNTDEILKINVSNSDVEVVYTVSNDRIIVMGEIVNNILYYFEILNASREIDLLAFDLNDSSPSGTLISNMDGYMGFVQDAYVKNNTLYTTIEEGGANRITKFNLNNSIPLSPEDILSPSNAPLGITSYQTDLFYVSGDQNIYRMEDSGLSLSSFEELQFSIWPNPVVENLNIKHQELLKGNYVIHSASGAAIMKGSLTKTTIDCSSLKSGFYFLTFKTGDQMQVFKFSKL